MPQLTALVQPSSRPDFERRAAVRQAGKAEALTRPLEASDTLAWGATVRDISASGIGLTLCYPFRAGTYLAIDLPEANGGTRTVLTRVVHAEDLPDGTWHVGCEFVKPLSDSTFELMV
jgi:PilZ domain-containing protein